MQFPIGSKVKLADYTSDDQIDYYIGQNLTVLEYREIEAYWADFLFGSDKKMIYIPNYSLLAPDGVVITANECELEVA